MTIEIIITALFIVVMLCNVVALVRHNRMMVMFQIMLNSFAETQKQFNDIMEEEQARRHNQPLPPWGGT